MSMITESRPSTHRVRAVSAILMSAFILLTSLTTPAQADEGKPGKGIPDSLQPCIGEALSSKAQQWVCTAEGLEVQIDGNGKANGRNKTPGGQLAPTSPPENNRTQQGPPASSGEIMTMAYDDYDTWCETGTICRRTITSYISETKGNAAYGNQNGVIGSYDIILRTNLNGRQANSRLSFIWDSGPSLSFFNTGIRCYEYAVPGINCGWHDIPAMWVGPTKYRSDSGTIYGNRLNNSNVYVNFAHTYFTPTGYNPYVAAQLESLDFNCFGTGNCYFP